MLKINRYGIGDTVIWQVWLWLAGGLTAADYDENLLTIGI